MKIKMTVSFDPLNVSSKDLAAAVAAVDKSLVCQFSGVREASTKVAK